MALIKMAAAARRAHAGSTKTIQKALREAGVPLVELAPGSFAVEEADLDRFLQAAAGAPPAESPKPTAKRKKPKPDRRR